MSKVIDFVVSMWPDGDDWTPTVIECLHADLTQGLQDLQDDGLIRAFDLNLDSRKHMPETYYTDAQVHAHAYTVLQALIKTTEVTPPENRRAADALAELVAMIPKEQR